MKNTCQYCAHYGIEEDIDEREALVAMLEKQGHTSGLASTKVSRVPTRVAIQQNPKDYFKWAFKCTKVESMVDVYSKDEGGCFEADFIVPPHFGCILFEPHAT